MKKRRQSVRIAGSAVLAMLLWQPLVAATSNKSPATATLNADDSTAVISFVRRSAFMADVWTYDVWDGDTFIGELAPNRRLQYRASPGEHVFLMMEHGHHVWIFMTANLSAGKQYFARAYPIPFHMEPLNANSAKARKSIDQWVDMKSDPPVSDDKRAKIAAKTVAEAQQALAALRAGEVRIDCAHWLPPNQQFRESKSQSSFFRCSLLDKMPPQFGR